MKGKLLNANNLAGAASRFLWLMNYSINISKTECQIRKYNFLLILHHHIFSNDPPTKLSTNELLRKFMLTVTDEIYVRIRTRCTYLRLMVNLNRTFIECYILGAMDKNQPTKYWFLTDLILPWSAPKDVYKAMCFSLNPFNISTCWQTCVHASVLYIFC